ncbi:BCCT family transporter [Salmonella enterica]|nr:BCCT family transporter [Salmonella enterica]
MLSNVKKKDVPLIAISLVAILLIATVLSLFPQQSALVADTLFNSITRLLGSAVQLLVLLILGLVIWLATGRYGNIRLGEGKAEYSTLSWLFMFICAGLGSSTLYWGVVEWAYYYQTPGLNIAPLTPKALEYSLPYSFFHWGVSAWATYTLASLIMAYHFHVRKNNGLSLSGIISAITGVHPQGFWGRLVDLMFLIATVGALTISLVVTAATFTRGLTAQNFLQMSLFTDPLGDGAFTRNWTVFYWLWWISYTPGVAMFVTRVSRGRKIKEVIWALLLGSTIGCWFFFGVMESYAMHQFVHGVINVPHIMQTSGGETVISQVLMSLPAGRLFLAAYLLVMIIFLASHMDAVAYTMAATSTRNLREGEEPERGLRLFWCVVITLIPLSILFTGASLETMKTTVVLTALPFLAILLVKTAGFLRWLKQDYAHVPVHLIETHVPEPAALPGQLPPGAVLKSDGQSL